MRIQSLASTAVVAAGLLADSACAKGSHVPLPASVQKRYESHFEAMSVKREVARSDPKDFRFLNKKTEGEFPPGVDDWNVDWELIRVFLSLPSREAP
jgi:hypothetical protein